jgi:hypothetical protein
MPFGFVLFLVIVVLLGIVGVVVVVVADRRQHAASPRTEASAQQRRPATDKPLKHASDAQNRSQTRKQEIIGAILKLKEGRTLVPAVDSFVAMIEAQERIFGRLGGSDLEKAVCEAFVALTIEAAKREYSKQISPAEQISLIARLMREHGQDIDTVTVANAVMGF